MAEKKSRFTNNVNIRNKRASYEYEFLDKFVAGLVLKGTEIKSIREGKANLQDGYCLFLRNELFVFVGFEMSFVFQCVRSLVVVLFL